MTFTRNRKISSPIFIIGSARSGKSLLRNFVAIHRDTCWFSNYTDRFVNYPIFSMIIRARDLPFIGNRIKRSIVSSHTKRFMPRPSEGNKIYHSYCKFEHARCVTAADLTDCQVYRFKKVVTNHVRFSGRPYFVNDQSANTQRIRQIVAIFPDAYFIHVIRDGRAVANEILRKNWWPRTDIWWFGNRAHVWEELGREPVVLCGLHWKSCLEAIFDNVDLFRDRYFEVRYEDLTNHTRESVRKVVEFCGMDWNGRFSRFIPQKLKNQNYRWKQELTQEQVEKLTKELGSFLRELKYT